MAEFESKISSEDHSIVVDPKSSNNDSLVSSEIEHCSRLCSYFPEELAENEALVKTMVINTLRNRSFDMESSRERLSNYFQFRRQMLGSLSDQSLESDPQLRSQLATCFVQVLPHRTPKGEGILYVRPDRHDPSTYSAEQTLRCWHYIILAAIKDDPSLAKSGFIVINDLSFAGYSNVDIRIPQLIGNAIRKCMPLRLVAAIAYKPPFLLRYLIPVMRLILSEKVGKRLNVAENPEEIANVCESFAERRLLPTSLGGNNIEYDSMGYIAHFEGRGFFV